MRQQRKAGVAERITREKLTRLDLQGELYARVLPLSRIKKGEVWEDPEKGHRIGVLDAASADEVQALMAGKKTGLIINDPPYNVKVGGHGTPALSKLELNQYLRFSADWVRNCRSVMGKNAHLYIWMGADVKDAFQPLPDFMLMMREIPDLKARNLITMRNQRGYGTQQNWMWVRQELLHYTRGKPGFKPVYTDIPKVLKGYYKTVDGQRMENLQRSRSENIRPGNVWIDIQQVFYRMEENVPGCYAQKPLKAIERIIETGSTRRTIVTDLFAHSGTTLIAGEKLGRKVYTCDLDPVFAELTIRRLEHFRTTGKTGWQWETPFPEIS